MYTLCVLLIYRILFNKMCIYNQSVLKIVNIICLFYDIISKVQLYCKYCVVYKYDDITCVVKVWYVTLVMSQSSVANKDMSLQLMSYNLSQID